MEYVYLVIEREFVHSDQSVYKIGRSSQENNSRIQQYPKGTQLICQLRVMDSHFLEREIIQLFKHKYKQRSDIGREYFEGDSFNMQLDIFTLISTYNFIVPNTSSLFSEFLQNHRSHMKPVLLQLVRVYKKKLLTTTPFTEPVFNIKNYTKKLICEICKYTTNYSCSYTRHIESKRHNDMKNITNEINNNSLHKCNICRKNYKSISGLWKHKNSQTCL
uniref:Uncharacterized protein n=1 Tax=viral metagenome TaxID=1070528 RepID=A0A6C0IBX6_9ZZZZ